MRDFDTELYELVAGIDESFKRIQTTAATLKDAYNFGENEKTLIKLEDEIKLIKRNQVEYGNILNEKEEEERRRSYEGDDDENNAYATGSSFLGF